MNKSSQSFFTSVFSIAKLEARFFTDSPRLLLAAAVVVLIPALYVVIYLASVWDPAAHTSALPVAIVNLDRGLQYRQHSFNVGRDVVSRLKARPGFGYIDVVDEQQARQQVRQGLLAFALIVPADFSSNAVPGAQAGAGKLVVFTSEGNSYPSAALARRFAEDLGREVNQSLNEQRWTLVLSDAAGSQRSMQQLHDGVVQLRLGARELAAGNQQSNKAVDALSGGADRVNDAVAQLTVGTKVLADGVKTMFSKRARNSDLNRLNDGAQTLSAGHEEMTLALEQLHQGAQRLQTGIKGFRQQASGSVFVPEPVREGLDQLESGVNDLEAGLKAAGSGQQRLADGASQLRDGVTVLSTGVRGLDTGIRSIVMQLPQDSELDELAQGALTLSGGLMALKTGSKKLTAGTQHLAGGLDLLEESLPANLKKMDGNAQGLANSVQPIMQVAAPVQNNGSGFAANIIPGALWLGASLAAFLIHMRRLPRQAASFSPIAKVAGKILLPFGFVLLQAFFVWLSLLFILHLNVLHVGALALVLGVASVTFLLLVFAMTRALGDAGKALALIFLAVQLSSSGGVLPVQLSGGLFAQISPYMPITWVVKAIKASLFGAFEGNWQLPLQQVALAGALAVVIACFVGRWRFVKLSNLRPALDL